MDNEDINAIRLRGQYQKHKLTLEEFSATKGEAVLEGFLGLDLRAQTFEIDLEGREIDFSTFRMINTDEKSIQGLAQLEIKGSGLLKNPVFSLQLSMENIRVQNAWIGSLGFRADSDGRAVNIRMETPLVNTSVAAKLTLEDPYLLKGQFNTESIDIWHTMRSGLEPLPSPIASQISATADFEIPLQDWMNATVSLNLEKGSFRYKELLFQATKPIRLKIENRDLIIEDFSIQGPQTEFNISGSLSMTEKQANNIQIHGSLNLRLLEALFLGNIASGLLKIDGSLSGSFLEPDFSASIELDNGHFISQFIPAEFHDISLRSKIAENVLYLDQLSIGIGRGNIQAKGQVLLDSLVPQKSLDESSPKISQKNEIQISLREIDLSSFTELLSEKLHTQFGGKIDGSVKLYGDFASISGLEMEGELTTVEFSLEEFKISNDEKIQFHMREGLFNLNPFRLSGGQSFLQAACKLSIQPEAQIDASFSASLESAILSSLLEDAVLGGNLSLDLNLNGALMNPVVSGLGKISDGFFQMEDPPLFVTNVDGTLDFSDTETTFLSLEGVVNGGSTNIQGKINYRSFAIVSSRIEMKADRVQVNYPEGFQALSGGTLILEKEEKTWFLRGDIKITQSYYNADIYPGGELINTIRTRHRVLRNDIPPIIRPLNLDIDLSTVDAFIIKNNLVDLELDGNIRVSGTVFDPRLSGFVRNRQTGQIVFGNHEYEVEQASLDFEDADPLEGQLSITGHTQISRIQLRNASEDLKVTLTITGTITNLTFWLSSSPSYPEIELASLLITGYGTESFRDDAAGVIGDQLMLYFLSPFASPFTNIVKNFLKAEEISIEPINIASEEDPGARFTFRKGLIRALELVYSTDISNTQNQTWVLDYNFSKNFALQSFAKDDGSYGGSFSHRFFLGSPGGGKKTLVPLRYKQFQIKDIHLEGDLIFPKSDLSRLSRSLKKGSVFSYKDLRKTIDTLEAFYKANDYLNVVIKSLLQQDNSNSITIILNITPLSPVAIAFEGDPLSKKLKREVIAKWNGRLPEEMSVSQVKKQILRDLSGKGHLYASVSYTKNNANGKSIYAFSVSLGPKYRTRNFTIDGQSSISPKAIKTAVSGIPKAKGKGLWVLFSDFKRAKLRIETLFSEYGYQNPVISRPQVHFDHDKKAIDISLPIDQGIQSRISSIQITGNSVFTDFDLTKAMSLKEGTIFSPTYLATDTNRLYSFYRSQGFHDVKIDVRELSGPDKASIGLLYTIQEGEVHTISSIEIRGNRRTPEHVIRRELTFKEGDILRTRDLIASQKNLYNLMIFRTVHIQREDNEGQRKWPKILVEVQEEPRFAVNYGLRYNSEEKLEGFGQLDLINILGRGNNGMFFYRQNDRQKDYRFSLQDPYWFGRRFNTLYSFFYTEETESTFREELWGLSIQQQLQTSLHSSFSYLFRINNTHIYELETVGPFSFDFNYFFPEFQIFWVRDTRAIKLNAKQGSFLSLSLTYSPEFLKTTLEYISFFGQYSLYVPISSGVVWASNYRIGLADAFDKVLSPRSLRFLAGGANSIRGFEREMVGPYDPLFQMSFGGEALFVMNQELRFPLYKGLEGVAFLDFGNVYENLEVFNPLDVRTGAGFGLRLYLSGIFLRLDYGINLSPREYEKKTVLYFSIGQAF
ncbi:MAG: translocation/assembly module TamB domain-containing protein [Candidatus Aminicenantes bacterium]